MPPGSEPSSGQRPGRQARRRVALDHDFPETLLDVVDRWVPEVELVPVRRLGEHLPDLEDHDLVHALADLGVPRMVTLDRMLNQPEALVAVHQTRFTLFVLAGGVGDDPVLATGALLRDLVPALRSESRRGQTADELIARYRRPRRTRTRREPHV